MFALGAFFLLAFTASADSVAPPTWTDPNTPFSVGEYEDFSHPINAFHESIPCTSPDYDLYFTGDGRNDGETFTEFFVSTSGGTERNLYAVADGTVLSVYDNTNMIEIEYYDDSGWNYIFQYVTQDTIEYTVGVGDVVEQGDIVGTINLLDGVIGEECYLWFGIYDVNADWYLDWNEFFPNGCDDTEAFGGEFNVKEWYEEYWNEETQPLWEEIISLLNEILAPPVATWYKYVLQELINTVYDYANTEWNDLGHQIKNCSLIYGSFSTQSNIIAIISSVSTAIAVIFWLLELVSKLWSVQDELFNNRRNYIKFLLWLLFTFWLMDNSVVICKEVLTMNNALLNRIFVQPVKYNISPVELKEIDGELEGSWLVNMFKLMIEYTVNSSMAMTLLLIVLIIAFCVWLKLLIRQMEIVCMMCVSPLFFACVAGEPTRQYFFNFGKTFVAVVAETLWMAIMYTMGAAYFNSQSSGLVVFADDSMSIWKMLIIVAIGFAMLKVPKPLKDLVSDV